MPTPTKPQRRKRGKYQVKLSGRSWGFRYTDNGQRKYAGGYPSKDAATQALASITANIKSGLPGAKVKPKGPARAFMELIPDWLEANKNKRSIQDDRNRWHKHLEPLLNNRAIDGVDTGLVDEIATGLKDVVGPATAERVLYTLSSFYRWAIRRNHITFNPVTAYLAGLERTERNELRTDHDPKDTPYLRTKADVVKLYKALPAPINIAYALSALAGLRPGEAIGVEWQDIDWDAATVRVSRQVRHGKVGPTKSGEARTVPIVPSLLGVLKEWHKMNRNRLVVPGRGNAHIGSKTLADSINAALKACGLADMTFYQAGRHTFASLWVLEGLDIYQLSKHMGHASVETTMRYAHLSDKVPDTILARADVAIG